MNTEEIIAILAQKKLSDGAAFDILRSIARMLSEAPDSARAQDLLIRTLERRKDFQKYDELLNALLRETGLYPYADPEKLSTRDLIAFEFHRPVEFALPGSNEVDRGVVFHRAQAQVYWNLIEGENVILSAPTSFGKSLIIDALIASSRYKRIALIVPTIALIDETRKRLSRFSSKYKIVTHASQLPDAERGTIYVLTQERVIERADLEGLDLFVIDEFYKLDPAGGGGDRAAILNHAFYNLLKTAKQFYLLGPNIRAISEDFPARYHARLIVSDFATVASDVRRVSQPNGPREALVELTKQIDGSTLIYCQSPASVKRVADLLISSEVSPPNARTKEVVEWVSSNFHENWIVTKALARGIGVHHGRLPRSLAQLQVRLFNEGILKFLVCTSTLIEGVNTAAKNVVVYDNKISRKAFDYFTFRNIQGRSGRMFRHFVGTVHLFHEPPEPDLLEVDFPAFSQSNSASDGLLVQLDEKDLGDEGLKRVNKIKSQRDLSFETIRANAHVDPQDQIELARTLRKDARALNPALAWKGEPTSDQLFKVCELLFGSLLTGVSRDAVRNERHLGVLISQLRQFGAAGFIRNQAMSTEARAPADPSDRVEFALEFLRNWASFHFPRALMALERIQEEVFSRMGLPVGSYGPFAMKIENLMLSASLAPLDEFGLPIQLVGKIESKLPSDRGLDEVLAALKKLSLDTLPLTQFEKSLIKQTQKTI